MIFFCWLHVTQFEESKKKTKDVGRQPISGAICSSDKNYRIKYDKTKYEVGRFSFFNTLFPCSGNNSIFPAVGCLMGLYSPLSQKPDFWPFDFNMILIQVVCIFT